MGTISEFDAKTVLIIGNGFDKSIGMNTSYQDFMKSDNFKTLQKDDSNTLIKYLGYKCKTQNNWIDIERELGYYGNTIIRNILSIPSEVRARKAISEIRKNFREEFDGLCIALQSYLKTENTRTFGIEIANTNAYKLIQKLNAEENDLNVLSFNYTNVAESIIGGIYEPIYKFIRYVHGKLDNNIVFGVQDNLDLNRDHVFLYKSHSQYKDVRGIPKILENANRFIFFGYSLGETDHTYFDDFFKAQTKRGCNKKIFEFYYYKNEGYDELIWQLMKLTGSRLSYLDQYNHIEMLDSSKPIELSI